MSADQLEAGRRALAGLEQVLREQPQKNDCLLAEVTKDLCRFRELLIGRREAGEAGASRRLDQLNAVISVVASVHYPLGEAPWDALKGGRDWVAVLVEASEGARSGAHAAERG